MVIPNGAQSYDELIFFETTNESADAEEAFRRAAARRFDAKSALNDLVDSDTARRARAKATLAFGIARHVISAGGRYRIDDLNTQTAVLQDCDARTVTTLDIGKQTFRTYTLDPLVIAYALGLDVTVSPGSQLPPGGTATVTGRAGGSIDDLDFLVRATPASMLRAPPFVNRFRYEYRTPIAGPRCPVFDSIDIVGGTLGPKPVLSTTRAMLRGFNLNVIEHIDALPPGIPDRMSFDASFPLIATGVVIRLHVIAADERDPTLALPAAYRMSQP